MSTLRVANIHFDAAASNRIEGMNDVINIYTSNASFSNNVSANYFRGNGAFLTGVTTDLSPAFNKANTALQNTSGVVFTGDFFVANSVGIGRTTTGYALDVVGTVNASALLINGAALSGGASVGDQTTSASTFYPVFTTTTSGTMSVANVATTKLYFVPSTGTLSATVFNSLSDITFKTDVEDFDGRHLIDLINPVTFNWKDTGGKSYGVIAQDLEQILPELVQTVDGIKSVSYIPMIAILIDVVKKQGEEIEKLKTLLNNQKVTE